MKNIIIILLFSILFLQLNAETYSPKKAFLMSAAIPGTGQKYTQTYTSMGIFISSEIGIILSYLTFKNQRDAYEESSKILARTKAGSSYRGNSEYYQTLQHYISSDDYNANIQFEAWEYFYLHNHDYEAYEDYVSRKSISADKAWKWKSQKDWNQYRKLRNNRQNYEIYAKLAAGAIIINHLISGIDAMRSARFKNKIFGKQTELFITPEFNKIGLQANYVIHF
jgi:hypothetical protein